MQKTVTENGSQHFINNMNAVSLGPQREIHMIINTPLSSYSLLPEGEHFVYFEKIIDLGTQESTYSGKTERARKIFVSCSVLGDARQENGKRFVVTKMYTASMHIKATLRKDIQAIFGRMSATEAMVFDTARLLKKVCIAHVKHVDSGGQLRVAIDRFSPAPEDMVLPEIENQPIHFDLSDPNPRVFMKLSDGIRKMIEASPEWQQHPMSKDWLKLAVQSTKVAEM